MEKRPDTLKPWVHYWRSEAIPRGRPKLAGGLDGHRGVALEAHVGHQCCGQWHYLKPNTFWINKIEMG